MKTRIHQKSVVTILIVSLVLSACGGCSSDDGGNSGRLKLSPIYESALWGAAIGGIIGHQSDEAANGAALGAGVFALGALLKQTDKMPPKPKEDKQKSDEEPKEVVIQIHNDNGSTTPVVLKKKGGTYMGPNGEHYKRLPTEEQLKPVYGL
ncbi:MAG: hypothetical protein ACYSWO_22090 [Planctomycetota bacterium]|jgi:hypothetical protein